MIERTVQLVTANNKLQQEIKGHTQTELALSQNEQKYRILFEASNDAIFLETVEGRILDCNAAACELYGYTKPELTALTVADLFPEETVLPPLDIDAAKAMGGRLFVESVGVKKEGLAFPIEMNSRLMMVGDKIRLLVYIRDITRRKKTERALRLLNDELVALNAIATAINKSYELDYIIETTLETVLKVVNIEASWIQLLTDDTTLSLIASRGFSVDMAQALKTTRVGQGVTGQVAQLGQPVLISDAAEKPGLLSPRETADGVRMVTGVPIKSKDTVLGVLGVFSKRPITLNREEVQLLTAIGQQIGVAIENIQLAEKASQVKLLEESDRLRAELIANVSHELRTPLGLIKIFCTTLQREDVDFDPETQKEFLQDIEAETERLEKLVNNLLNLSRIQEGQLRLDKQPADVGALVQNSVKDMSAHFSEHQIVKNLPDEPLVAVIDSRYIEQVLRNLISNAIKYSPQGGTITIDGYAQDNQLCIQVRDQGIGIAPSDLEKVFERFYRTKNEHTQNIGGVGLGLAVCKGIVEAHNGRIWVESIPGEGSAFKFILPLDDNARTG